jgi:hypothetical protein
VACIADLSQSLLYFVKLPFYFLLHILIGYFIISRLLGGGLQSLSLVGGQIGELDGCNLQLWG